MQFVVTMKQSYSTATHRDKRDATPPPPTTPTLEHTPPSETFPSVRTTIDLSFIG